MSDLDHRVGVSEANLVVRRLKLQGLDASKKTTILESIDEKFGVDSVSLNEEKQVLIVAYDALNCCIDSIEEVIQQSGAKIKQNNWWARFKVDYYRFVDQNIKDNAKQEPWGCHRR